MPLTAERNPLAAFGSSRARVRNWSKEKAIGRNKDRAFSAPREEQIAPIGGGGTGGVVLPVPEQAEMNCAAGFFPPSVETDSPPRCPSGPCRP